MEKYTIYQANKDGRSAKIIARTPQEAIVIMERLYGKTVNDESYTVFKKL
ncbi:MAG: hypothetical protein ACI4M5_02900 [Christensenellales bacterium]